MLHLNSPIIRQIRSRRNSLLRVRLLGRTPASIILRLVFAYTDVSVANHSESDNLLPRVTSTCAELLATPKTGHYGIYCLDEKHCMRTMHSSGQHRTQRERQTYDHRTAS
jgi:hypothetical protein